MHIHFFGELAAECRSVCSGFPLVELFDSIFATVRTLKLLWFDLECRPVCSGFRLLTTLQLLDCRFFTDGELVEPYSQFPCLNDLVLGNCSWHRTSRLRVSGLELAKLSLLQINVSKLEIFAPKLKSFKLLSREQMEFSEQTLTSLVHADIGNLWGCSYDEDFDIDKQHLVFMLHGLRKVEYLTLCKEMREAVCRKSKFLEQQPCPFTKLKKLKLVFDSRYDIPYKVMNK